VLLSALSCLVLFRALIDRSLGVICDRPIAGVTLLLIAGIVFLTILAVMAHHRSGFEIGRPVVTKVVSLPWRVDLRTVQIFIP
jgi:hypothetical protein